MPRHTTHLVRSYSGRNGVKPRLLTMHTTEGLGTLDGLANFFDNPATQASSHKATNRFGDWITMVRDEDKAWTQESSNPFCLSIEQLGFASTAKRDWIVKYHNQLKTDARILAVWAAKYNIPIQWAHSAAGTGIISHNDLPGTHWDPGPGFPFNYLVWFTRYQFLLNAGKRRRAARYANLIKGAQAHYGVPARWRTTGYTQNGALHA